METGFFTVTHLLSVFDSTLENGLLHSRIISQIRFVVVEYVLGWHSSSHFLKSVEELVYNLGRHCSLGSP